MGFVFNGGLGGVICDKCRIMMFEYMPPLYGKSFLENTKESGKFKGVNVWSKKDKRFCSAKCMKEFNNEDSILASVIYDNKLCDS